MKYRLAGASYRMIAEKLTEGRANAYADANGVSVERAMKKIPHVSKRTAWDDVTAEMEDLRRETEVQRADLMALENAAPRPAVRPVPTQARAGSGDGVSMAARSFVACAATWRAVSPPSAARCAMSDSLSRRPPFPQRRHPTATPPARPSDAKQQSRPAPDTGHGPWYSRPTRRQPGRPCSAASRSGQCVTPHQSRRCSVGRSDAFSG